MYQNHSNWNVDSFVFFPSLWGSIRQQGNYCLKNGFEIIKHLPLIYMYILYIQNTLITIMIHFTFYYNDYD